MKTAACDSETLITVCLVEDDDFFRAHVERWLADTYDMACVGSYRDAETALPNIWKTRPSVVILDFGLPGMKGKDCLQQIKQVVPTVRVLVLTGIPDDSVVFDSLVHGADGFLEKSDRFSRREELVHQIRELHAGGAPLSARAARLLLEAFKRFKPAPWEGKDFTPLTPREMEIMKLMRQGLPDKAIAAQLGISQFTVNAHMKNIFETLDVHCRSEAVSRLFGNGGGTLIHQTVR